MGSGETWPTNKIPNIALFIKISTPMCGYNTPGTKYRRPITGDPDFRNSDQKLLIDRISCLLQPVEIVNQ